MKKIISALLLAIILSALLAPATLAMKRESGDTGSLKDTAESMVEEALTDIESDMDYDAEDGKPLAEEDGKVDRDTEDDRNTTAEQSSEALTETRPAEDSTGIIEGMELEEKGINPWAIVIAVIIVISVLILIFVLIPKRG